QAVLRLCFRLRRRDGLDATEAAAAREALHHVAAPRGHRNVPVPVPPDGLAPRRADPGARLRPSRPAPGAERPGPRAPTLADAGPRGAVGTRPPRPAALRRRGCDLPRGKLAIRYRRVSL